MKKEVKKKGGRKGMINKGKTRKKKRKKGGKIFKKKNKTKQKCHE